MEKFTDNTMYQIDELKGLLRLSKLQWEMEFPGEEDFLLALADLKLLLSVEVKCHINIRDKELARSKKIADKKVPYIDGNLKSASNQLKKNAMQMAKLNAPILSKGWKFVKVASVLPHILNPERVCGHCRKFIITEEDIKNPGGLP